MTTIVEQCARPVGRCCRNALTFAGTSGAKFRRGFTLIEMLVVIGIIGLLAGIILGVAPAATRSRTLKRAQVELKWLEGAIENYKQTRGYYPPCNTNNFAQNSLFYELTGTKASDPSGASYTSSLKPDHTIQRADITMLFNAGGILNAGGLPETTEKDFLRTVKQEHYAQIPDPNNKVAFALVAQGKSTGPKPDFNPWRYDCSSPNRHNLNGFDLWTEILLGKTTNLICNWKTQ